MKNIFDFQARISEDWNLHYTVAAGPKIIVSKLADCGRDQPKILRILMEEIKKDKVLGAEFRKLKCRLYAAILKTKHSNHIFWQRQRLKRPSDEVLKKYLFTSNDGLRRGISKLICLSSEIEKPITSLKDKKFLIPPFVNGVGWSRRASLKGEVIVDPDILHCLKAITQLELDKLIERIQGRVYSGMYRVAIRPIVNLGVQSSSISGFFRGEVTKFTDFSSLQDLICKTVADPSLGGQVVSQRPWVFDYCLAIGKSIEDRPQGYGISQLVRDMNISGGDQLRFWIPDYNNGKFSFRNDILKRCCEVLSSKVVEAIKKCASIENLIQKAAHWGVHQLSEIKLCTYPLFRPAEVLTLSIIESKGVSWEVACLEPDDSLKSGTSGICGTTAGIVSEIKGKRVFIKAICGAKNTRDKAKELSGRAAITSDKFDLLVLILDGPYEFSEAKMCRLCGWDIVIGVNELPSLLQIIEKTLESEST
jgi:hypothetical protein